MNAVFRSPKALTLIAMLALPMPGTVAAQELASNDSDVLATVYGSRMSEGPKIEGIISARDDDKVQITGADGSRTVVLLDDQTRIKGSGGFLGMGSKKVAAESLLAGLPVSVETLRWGRSLVASEIKFKKDDLQLAAMIHNGTNQRFEQQAAATEALRGRMGDIDKYNIKGTTNVYFDSGKWQLSGDAERELCTAASQAEGMDNAMLLVVGYTDSTGSYEVNQMLSEKRAGRVVNYLQQACGWKPWRMLTPTGMATADPLASNDTDEGKAQNRRVSVNILVSKGLDGM